MYNATMYSDNFPVPRLIIGGSFRRIPLMFCVPSGGCNERGGDDRHVLHLVRGAGAWAFYLDEQSIA